MCIGPGVLNLKINVEWLRSLCTVPCSDHTLAISPHCMHQCCFFIQRSCWNSIVTLLCEVIFSEVGTPPLLACTRVLHPWVHWCHCKTWMETNCGHEVTARNQKQSKILCWFEPKDPKLDDCLPMDCLQTWKARSSVESDNKSKANPSVRALCELILAISVASLSNRLIPATAACWGRQGVKTKIERAILIDSSDFSISSFSFRPMDPGLVG